MGEKRDEQRVLEQAGRLHETGAAIEQIADLGKSEEGNTQWQEDTFGAIGIQAPTLKHAQQSDEILVVEEQRQVARYTERHHPALTAWRTGLLKNIPADHVVEQNGCRQQHYKARIPPAIKHERCGAQPQRRPTQANAPKQVVAPQSHRQKQKQKEIGVEEQGELSEWRQARAARPGSAAATRTIRKIATRPA